MEVQALKIRQLLEAAVQARVPGLAAAPDPGVVPERAVDRAVDRAGVQDPAVALDRAVAQGRAQVVAHPEPKRNFSMRWPISRRVQSMDSK